MKFIPLFVLFLIVTGNVKAQDTAIVRKAAITMANALLKNDLVTLADYTHPKILASMGGKDKTIAIIKASLQEMKTGGMTFRNVSIGKIGKFYTAGKELYCLIPQEISMNKDGGYLSSMSSVLGISTDQGKTWKFVSAGNIGRDRLKVMFPNMPGGLEILPQTDPVFHKTD